jgi:DNA repair exonuclease SbcCD nuclease subunit
MRFIHTADWQLGKPFAGVADARKRALVQQARIDAIKRIGVLADEHGAEFVLVAGDLFDSTSADKATVSAACSAVGQIRVPVIVIPGNHDNGGPGSVWGQGFFQREREALAPNLRIVLEAAPLELDSAVILPCPLLRRTMIGDPTEWLRSGDAYSSLPSGKPRIVLAHGSTQAFSSGWADDDEDSSGANLIDLGRLPDSEIDYIALGDWHGTKQVGAKAWYSGTPELDRFPKGADHDAGNVLVVDAERGGVPVVSTARVGSLNWVETSIDLAGDEAPRDLETTLAALVGTQTAESALLHLSLTGAIGIGASDELGRCLESLESRLLRLKLVDGTTLAPTTEEVEALTARVGDPLIARVAAQLVERADRRDEAAEAARVALRELYAACMRGGGS